MGASEYRLSLSLGYLNQKVLLRILDYSDLPVICHWTVVMVQILDLSVNATFGYSRENNINSEAGIAFG